LTTFADLGVLPATVEALEAFDIREPFPIQALAIPVALGGHDIIGQAKTGTGKTLGFGVPLLQRLVGPQDDGFADHPSAGRPQALVVVPTRELCVQVTRDLDRAGSTRGVRVLSIYGGRAYEPQVEALRKGVEVVVGTPGRLIDLAQQKRVDLSQVRTLVLDEADEMLDLGFLPDVERIIGMTDPDRQTMLFSATMPGAVIALGRQYMRNATHIRAAVDPNEDGHTVAAVEQHVFRAHAMDKIEMLARILQATDRGLTMVFSRTKRTAAQVADDLASRGFASAAVHGDLGQGAREQALRAFRSGKVDVLVATDVAARGIDVEDVTHVVNYQCPEDEKIYLHRIGRTARAGKSGTAITFVDWDDMPRWALIDKALDLGFGEPRETYSTSEHFYAELGIPEGTTGVLPRAARSRAGLEAEELEDLGETGAHRSRGGRPPGRDSRGGRSGDGRVGRGDRDDRARRPEASGDGGGESAERPPRSGTSRKRRRTRGGQPVTGDSGAAPGSGSGAAAASDGGAGHSGGTGEATDAPRRRRRRGGRGRGSGTGSPAPASTD
jgi:superfamily II DNA/RNA helicase